MFKKQIFMPCSILFFLALTLFPDVSVNAETVNLNYSIFFPSTHGQCEAGVAWAKAIEERSNGKIKITVFPGGTLTNANQTFKGVENGIADIGMSCFAYTPGRFPVMEALDLPLGYSNGQVATKVANEYYEMNKPKELDSVKVLYLHAHGPGLLHTRKPVHNLADMKNLLIRSTGLSAKVVEALGGVPVAKSQGETYEALQKGTVQGTIGPMEVLKGWNQGEVIKYTTDCSSVGYTTAMFVVMNLNKWNSLPEDLKAVMTEVSKEWVDNHGKTWDFLDNAGRSFTLGRGNEIISLSSEEQQVWQAAVKPVIDEYVTTVTGKGFQGQKMVNDIQGLIEKYSPKP